MTTGAFSKGGPSLPSPTAVVEAAIPLNAEHRAWYLERLGSPRTILAGRRTLRHEPRTGEVSDADDWQHVPCSLDVLRDWSHIRIGGPKYVVFINVDIDLPFDEAEQRLRQFPLPANLFGQNMNSGHVHAQFLLRHPVNLDDPRERDNLAALRVQLTEALGGDPAYRHGSARNPLAMNTDYIWRWGHADGFSISELRAACYEVLGDDWQPQRGFFSDDEDSAEQVYGGHSMVGCSEDSRGFWWDESGTQVARQRTLFEVLRHAGYDLRRSGLEGISPSHLQPIADQLLDLFQELEPRRRPIHSSFADATIRSVVKFCNEVFKPGVGGSRSQRLGRVGGENNYAADPEGVERILREKALPASIIANQMRAITDAERIRIEKELHPDLSQREIADRLGFSQSKVRRALSDVEPDSLLHHVDPEGLPSFGGDPDSSDRSADDSLRHPPSTRFQQVIELTRKGYSNTEIAHELGISMRSVQRLRAQAPLEMPINDAEEPAESIDGVIADAFEYVWDRIEAIQKGRYPQRIATGERGNSMNTSTNVAQGASGSPGGAQGAPNGSRSTSRKSETLTGRQMGSDGFEAPGGRHG